MAEKRPLVDRSKYEHNRSVTYQTAVWIRSEGPYFREHFELDLLTVRKLFNCDIRERELWSHPFYGGIIVMGRRPGITSIDGNYNVTLYETRIGIYRMTSRGPLHEIFEDFNSFFSPKELVKVANSTELLNIYFR